jgi:hypothetical protein
MLVGRGHAGIEIVAICQRIVLRPDRQLALLPRVGKAHAAPIARVSVGKDPRGLNSVGARGFQPPTFCSQIYEDDLPGNVKPSQPSEMITDTDPPSIQPSQPVQEKPKILLLLARPSYPQPSWRSSYGPTARCATRTCPRRRRKHASARTNAPSAKRAFETNYATSAPIAAAGSPHDRSGPRRNGARGSPSQSGRHRPSGGISRTAARRSPSFHGGSKESLRSRASADRANATRPACFFACGGAFGFTCVFWMSARASSREWPGGARIRSVFERAFQSGADWNASLARSCTAWLPAAFA